MKFQTLIMLPLVLLMLGACATAPSQPTQSGAAQPVTQAQKLALYRYEATGQYAHDIARADAAAKAYVLATAKEVKRPALVLDIDETSLSNWPELAANDLVFRMDGPCDRLPKGPCGLHAWDEKGLDKAIAPTLALFRAARAHGVTVFFLTGRDESLRAATARNLHAAGYAGYKQLIMRPHGTTTKSAADYKAARRAWIESQGYLIVATVGDQESDLAGGHALRGFKLPNPFYTIP